MNKLLIICGPTATGKTALAVQMAKKFNGELVSADSRQVYIGMDIGTGKDRATIDVPVWLLDVVRPDEEFSVSAWVKLARQAIADILSRNKLPIVVGGTGLYIHALIHPPETMGIPPDKKLREKLKDASVEVLQHMIDLTILQSMNQSDRQNPRRLIRKIEIARLKKTLQTSENIYDYLSIGLTAPRSVLYKRIDDRVDERLRQGMKEEVETLVKKYGRNLSSMSALGYRSLEHWKKDEHSYARRQLTWFNKQKDITWFDVTGAGYPENVTKSVLAWYTGNNHEHKD